MTGREEETSEGKTHTHARTNTRVERERIGNGEVENESNLKHTVTAEIESSAWALPEDLFYHCSKTRGDETDSLHSWTTWAERNMMSHFQVDVAGLLAK